MPKYEPPPTYRDFGFDQFVEKKLDFALEMAENPLIPQFDSYSSGQLAGSLPGNSISNDKILNLEVQKLETGSISSKQITLAIEEGTGDSYIAGGKTDFTNTETGWIIGIDDSDSNTPKFYIGNSTFYLNWTGSALNIAGTLTASSIHIPDLDTTANSMHVESDGDTWWGTTQTLWTASTDNATAYVLRTGEAKFTDVRITGLRSGSSVVPMPNDSILAGYWSFDEGTGSIAVDQTNNANHGTIATATYTGGVSGTCLSFNGTSGSVLITDQTAIQNIWDGGGALSVRIRPTTDGEADTSQILNKDQAGSDGWGLQVENQTGSNVRIRFFVRFSGDDGAWLTDTNIPVSAWTHVVVIYNSDSTTNDPTIFINGTSVTVTESETPTGTRNTDVGNDFYIGNRSGDDRTFDGLIDEVRLYNATITTPQAIALNENPGGITPQGVKSLGGRYYSASSGARVQIFPDANTGLLCEAADGTDVLKVEVGGTNTGDVTLGNYSGNTGALWDQSASAFNIKGTMSASQIQGGNFTIDLNSPAWGVAANIIPIQLSVSSSGNMMAVFAIEVATNPDAFMFVRLAKFAGQFYPVDDESGAYASATTSATNASGAIYHNGAYYWSINDNVFERDAAGNTAMTFSGTAASGMLATDDTNLYILDDDDDVTVRKYTISGTTITFVSNTTLDAAAPDGFYWDGTSFWGRNAGVIKKYNSSGVTQSTITLTNAPINLMPGVFVDGGNVYIAHIGYWGEYVSVASRLRPGSLTFIPVAIA